MKQLLLAFCLFVQTSLCWAQLPQDTIYKVYKGNIGGERPITMELYFVGEECFGRYYYEMYLGDISLKGRVEENGHLELQEGKGAFNGYFDENLSNCEGIWSYPPAYKRYDFSLSELKSRSSSVTENLQYDRVKAFQEFVNYFDIEPQLPLHLKGNLEEMTFKWKDPARLKKVDFKKYIPYDLAQRYIMSQVSIETEGDFNYFRIPKEKYKEHEMAYRSICCLFRKESYITFLINFREDNGWDDYDVCFILSFDYEGNLIGELKASSAVILERTGQFIQSQSNCIIHSDSSMTTEQEQKLIFYGQRDGQEYYEEKKVHVNIDYLHTKDGRFFPLSYEKKEN